MERQSINPESLDLIYEVTREGPPNQFREMEAVDGKLIQIFSVGSVIIGLASVAAESDTLPAFLVAVAAYVAVAGGALWGLRGRMIMRPFHSDTLLEDFWSKPAGEIKYALACEMPIIHQHNQEVIDSKAGAARIAVLATAIEVAALGVMVTWGV